MEVLLALVYDHREVSRAWSLVSFTTWLSRAPNILIMGSMAPMTAEFLHCMIVSRGSKKATLLKLLPIKPH